MKITRDIITDLLAVYQSGEASQDTCDLLEAYMQENPEFAQIVNAQSESQLMQEPPALPKEFEMETLEKTKKLLWQRSMYMGFAILFTFSTFAFNFSSLGVRWNWADTPIVALVLFAVGMLFWFKYAQTTGKLKGSAL